MGTRVTRAATHVSAEVIQQRMRAEASAWRRRYWHIIWLALSAPRHAEEIARQVGVSPVTVHRVLARYRRGGAAAIEGVRKGGRRHGCLPLSQEAAFLAPFAERAAGGERVRVEEIQQALHTRLGQAVHRVTVERLLARHGWRWRDTSGRAAQPAPGVAETAVGPQERPSAPAPPVAERSRRPLPGGQPRALPRYPSDLTDQEWALVEPLLPPAKSGGDRAAWTCAKCSMPCSTWTAPGVNGGPAQRLSALADGVDLLPPVAQRRHLGTSPYGPARAGARQGRPGADAQRGHHRQSIGEDQPKGGGAAMTAARRSRAASATSSSIPTA